MPFLFAFSIDLEAVRLTSHLSVGQRVQRLLDGREMATGLMRGRLRRLHPDLSPADLNLKLLEVLEGARNASSRM